MVDLEHRDKEKAANQLLAAKNILACKTSSRRYSDFVQLMHPDRAEFDDYTKSAYVMKPFHQVIADAVDMVDSGEHNRLIITVPPRYGKTETAAKKFIPYYMGKHPERHVIYATYGLELSKETGADVIHTMKSKRYQSVFPDVRLRTGGTAKDRVQTEEGGVGIFVGRGGPITGKGAHVLIIDDLIKDDEEASSPATMEKCWQWYNKVATTRLMDDKSAIIIIMTRWSDNDIVGRILDPSSPNYDPEEAAKWKEIRISALCEDPKTDPMNRQLGEALWPERFSATYLESLRRQDPRGFACLQQQNPAPEDGVYFEASSIKEYRSGQEPSDLRIYASSDFAVSTKQHNDCTCHLVVGIDSHDNVWILDCWWQKLPSDKSVRAMIDLMQKWKPITWWAESGHISKSVGPFLRKMMMQEGVFCAVEEVTVTQNKETRAQSIKGYMSMGKVYFPRDAVWYGQAIQQILKFGGGSRFDDFVDALSIIGTQLARLRGKNQTTGFKKKHKKNTFGEFKQKRTALDIKSRNRKLAAGF
jgi:predicted phage terminase large subunit-like protein